MRNIPIYQIRKDNGYTVIELAMVLVIIAVLASIGITQVSDIRYQSRDVQAYTAGRNLMVVASDAFLYNEDIVFGTNGGYISGDVGTVDSNGDPRSAVFTLPKEVQARIEHTDASTLTCFIKHVYGRKEYFFGIVDGAISLASL